MVAPGLGRIFVEWIIVEPVVKLLFSSAGPLVKSIERHVCKTSVSNYTVDIGEPVIPFALKIFLGGVVHELEGVGLPVDRNQANAGGYQLLNVCFVRFVKFGRANFNCKGMLNFKKGKWPG